MSKGLLITVFAGLAAYAVAQAASCEPICTERFDAWVAECRDQYLNSTITVAAFSECVDDAYTIRAECNQDCSIDLLQEQGENGLCACPRILDPVCGSDGVTYNNPCLAECADVRSYQKGACTEEKLLQEDGLCACPRILDPVCGSDGVTYNNPCLAECADVRSYQKGACAEEKLLQEDACPIPVCLPSSPICGSDGVTYIYPCLFDYAQCLAGLSGEVLTQAHDGECRNTDLLQSECPIPVCLPSSPICGSDGVTYTYPCLFEHAQCLAGLDGEVLTQAHAGECRNTDLLQSESCEATCNANYLRRVVHCNTNALGSEICIRIARANHDACLSACGTTSAPALLQECGCDRSYQPVCGGNGVTYNNQCLAVCDRVTFFTLGECRDDELLQENECPIPVCLPSSPICGSDGVTYTYPCLFDYAQCLAGLNGEVLTQAHDGECRSTDLLQRENALVCELPAETGPCFAAFPRWHYNATSGECELFTYGGCQGNGNNFATERQCETVCA